jgi:hypothetical protein
VRGEVREEYGGIRKGSMDLEGDYYSFRVFTRGILGGSLGTDLAVGDLPCTPWLRGLGTEG